MTSHYLKNSRIVTSVFVAFVSLFLIAGCGLKQNATAGDTVAQSFLSKMRAKDFQGARQLLAPTVRQKVTNAQLSQAWNLLSKRGGQLNSWSFNQVNVTSNEVNLVYVLHWSKRKASARFKVRDVGGSKWLIQELGFR